MIELGHEFVAEFIANDEGERVGAFITGPAAPGCKYTPEDADPPRCGGYVNWNDEPKKWTLHSLDPLHLEPSVQCHCGGQHGYIRDGKWEPC